MRKKNIQEEIKSLAKGTVLLKSFLFMFLGLFLFTNAVAQCPPVANITVTANASAVGVADGNATVTISPNGGGNFWYYWMDTTTAPTIYCQTDNSAISTDNCNVLPSGMQLLRFIDATCGGTIDTLFLVTAPGGSISMTDTVLPCGIATISPTVEFTGCAATPANNFGVQFVLESGGLNIMDTTLTGINDTTLLLDPLPLGNYTLTITDLDNGCTNNITFNITGNPPTFASSATVLTSVVDPNATPTTDTTVISLTTPISATAPYTLTVYDAANILVGTYTFLGTDTTLVGLGAGDYTYYIEDACIDSSSGVFTVANQCTADLNFGIPFDPCASSAVLSASIVNNGTALGAVYIFDLSDDITGNVHTSAPHNFTFYNAFPAVVNSADYYLMVSDTLTGCVAYDTLTVTFTPLTINSTVLNTTSAVPPCDGSVTLNPIGVPGYVYQWYNGFPPFTPLASTTNSITNLCEGDYCYSVTDTVSGCQDSTCVEVELNPCGLSTNDWNPPLCNGDTGTFKTEINPIPATGTGPNGPGNGFTYTLYDIDGNPLTFPVNTSLMEYYFHGIPAGTYIVEVIDESYPPTASCIDTFVFLDPPEGTIYTTIDSSSAGGVLDGSITLDSVTNLTLPITSIIWEDSTATVFDPAVWSSTGNDSLADSLLYSNAINGGYTLTIIDALGCPHDTLLFIHPRFNADSAYIDSIHITQPSCFGDTDARLFARMYNVPTHSVPPFTFYWKAASDIFHNGAPPTNYTGGDTIRIDSLGSLWYNSSHVAILQNLGAGLVTLDAYDYYNNYIGSYDYTIVEPDSIVVTIMDSLPLIDPANPQFNALGDTLEMDCGYGYNLNSWITGGNVTNDTIFDLYNFTLDFTNPPNSQMGWSDTFEIGTSYIIEITGSLDTTGGIGDYIDPLYNFSNGNDTIVWNMNGTIPTSIIAQPTYNGGHTYFIPLDSIVGSLPVPGFPGFEVYEFSICAGCVDLVGQLDFTVHKIIRDTFMYNYSWEEVPPTFPTPFSNMDTAWAYPGPTPTTYVLNITDVVHACPGTDTIVVQWDLYTLAFDSVATTDILPCYGDSTGIISVIADTNYGFLPTIYTYYIDSVVNPNFAPDDTVFTDLPAGTYYIEMVDLTGCVADTLVTLTQPSEIRGCSDYDPDALSSLFQETFTFQANDTSTHSYTTAPFEAGVPYLIEVSGTFGWELFVQYYDAQYIYNISPPGPDPQWDMDGVTLIPTPPDYNPTHNYEYEYLGDGLPHTFTFNMPLLDDTVDNIGSLTFTISQRVCPDTDTAYTCFGDSTGFSSISAYGGVPFADGTYNYQWTDAIGTVWGTDSMVTGLPAGSYTVTVTDSVGCNEFQRYLEVIQPAAPLSIDATDKLNVMCYGDSTGVIKVYTSGGFQPHFSFLIREDKTTGALDTITGDSYAPDSIIFDSLTAAFYHYYLYDSIPDTNYSANIAGSNIIGLMDCGKYILFDVLQPQDPLQSAFNSIQHVKCWGDSTGVANVDVIGGQFPYTYLWDNGETTAQADSLWADPNLAFPSTLMHTVIITDSNNCTIIDSVEIEHIYEEIIVDMNLDGVEDQLNIIQHVSCYAACDAMASIASTGGVFPHKYFWDNGHIGHVAPDTAHNLCFGGHNVIIEDALGCRVVDTFQITQPDELFAQAILVDPITCYGEDDGIASAAAVGGTVPYTFYWDSIPNNPPAFGGLITTMNVSTPDTLTPGIHFVYVIDAEGCIAFDTVSVPEPDTLVVSIIEDSTIFPYCLGTTSGQLCADVTGGTYPYYYSWDDNLTQTTSCAVGLVPDIYTITVLDDRNCVSYAVFSLDSVTSTFIEDSVSIDITHVSCFGEDDGSIDVFYVGGGVGPYDYDWNGPNNYSASQPAINFLYSGNYSLDITDGLGCKISLDVDILQPDKLEYTTYNVLSATCVPEGISAVNASDTGSCDGQIWVYVEGGTSPYYYDYDEAGVYPFSTQVELVDDSLIFNLCTGDHQIYITDSSGCIGTVLWGGRWEETVDSGVVVTVSSVITDPASCFNTFSGSATVVNPDLRFTYTWETLSGVVVDSLGTVGDSLYPGDYNLAVHYADSISFGQIYTACNYSIPFTITSPDVFGSGALADTEVSCYGYADGAISLNPTTIPAGGVLYTPFTYQWDTTASLPNGSTDAAINNLLPGQYVVQITDDIGCIITDSFTIGEPEPISVNFDVTPVSCYGDADGIITANVSPTGFVYTYNWSGTPGSNPLTNADIGVYTLIVTNTNGCKDTFDIEMVQPDVLTANIETQSSYGQDENGNIYHVSCYGGNNGALTAIATGGVFPYSYLWDDVNAQTTANAGNLTAGQYIIEITDANGCTEDDTITLVQPDELMINAVESGDLSPYGFDISCKGFSDGAIYTYATGGYLENNSSYSYLWQGNIGNQLSVLSSIEDLQIGNYEVTIMDDNGCTKDSVYILDEPLEYFTPVINRNDVSAASHPPVRPLFTDATVTTDIINHTWWWTADTSVTTLNSVGQTFTNEFTEIGVHEVTVYITNTVSGCIDDTTFMIEVQGVPDPINNIFTPNGDGINDEFTFGEFGMEILEVSIFNRWGQLVHSWTTQLTSWNGIASDGEKAPEGVYYYVFKSEGEDGTYYEKKGTVTLLR